uniref:Uncharacterized protein n=1 Tax=Chromera velia CCMP2878 TaxID=1169474 RepID=A0A0G4FPH1_9ALVE|mmetsp:Transcript_11068/g.21361  ORF Transcript_11068/g.21361 Transcript_11068/m.21361 type:complete len:186 (-) Transcript_11068:45-602(-)|eukprot:Cvel_3593.t1-p1 / transcript=Cvel_3593.t1 / gene=Cvel_3593 / organism=Chromera_velia_CCMP2878 / gene_product=hypothetical protein / transcript_product=hypothetical protein / location=Cvel_scaffold147:52316-53240(-) / protein_length=185 / sequence_SO=supercontig / SO=protein_coding / is_pseudo=false
MLFFWTQIDHELLLSVFVLGLQATIDRDAFSSAFCGLKRLLMPQHNRGDCKFAVWAAESDEDELPPPKPLQLSDEFMAKLKAHQEAEANKKPVEQKKKQKADSQLSFHEKQSQREEERFKRQEKLDQRLEKQKKKTSIEMERKAEAAAQQVDERKEERKAKLEESKEAGHLAGKAKLKGGKSMYR